MKVLVIDIGGNSVKVLLSDSDKPRKFPSGPTLMPREMVEGILKLTEDWKYDVISIGYPGLVHDNRPSAEPVNLGRGWVEFDYRKAFGTDPGRVIAVGIMTDTDNTKSKAESWYGDIALD